MNIWISIEFKYRNWNIEVQMEFKYRVWIREFKWIQVWDLNIGNSNRNLSIEFEYQIEKGLKFEYGIQSEMGIWIKEFK